MRGISSTTKTLNTGMLRLLFCLRPVRAENRSARLPLTPAFEMSQPRRRIAPGSAAAASRTACGAEMWGPQTGYLSPAHTEVGSRVPQKGLLVFWRGSASFEKHKSSNIARNWSCSLLLGFRPWKPVGYCLTFAGLRTPHNSILAGARDAGNEKWLLTPR